MRQQVPGLLEPLNGSGVEGGGDLEDAHEVVELQSVLSHLQPEGDDGGALARVGGGEGGLGHPLSHLVEAGDDVADVGGQLQAVLLGPLLL